jgi:hypothetical protein
MIATVLMNISRYEDHLREFGIARLRPRSINARSRMLSCFPGLKALAAVRKTLAAI